MPLTKVSSGVIAANAVVDSFGTQSITGDKIGLGAITGNTLASNIINANNIVDASITGTKLAANTVSGDVIGQNAISSNNIVSVNASVATVGTLPKARLPSNSVLQVVSTTKLDRFSSTSGTMTDITGMSVNITPTNSSNKILIIASLVVSADTWDTAGMQINLVRDSTNLGVGTSGSSSNATSGYNAWAGGADNTRANHTPMIITFFDSPNTTSSTTYKLQGRNNTNGYTFVIGGRMSDSAIGYSSTITVMEIAG